MKKIYTLAIALLAIAGSSVAAVPSANFDAMKEFNPKGVRAFSKAEKTTELNFNKIVAPAATEEATASHAPAKKAFAKPQTVADLNNQILAAFVEGNVSNTSYGYEYVLDLQIKAGEGNNLKIGPFFYENAVFDATFDAEAQTITIPANQQVNVGQGTLTMAEMRMDDQYMHDIVLHLDAERNAIRYIPTTYEQNGDLYYSSAIIMMDVSNPNDPQSLANIYMIDGFYVNSLMAYCTYDYDTQQYSEFYYTYIWVENVDGQIAVSGLYGITFNRPVYFTVDAAKKTATATDQVVYVRLNGTEEEPFYLWVPDSSGRPGSRVVEMEFNINTEANEIVMRRTALGLINADATKGDWRYYTQILMPYDPFEAGSINSVAADTDANAPVEYFNLQGVRVANPEAGQLVIKRQGSTVSKVVIR